MTCIRRRVVTRWLPVAATILFLLPAVAAAADRPDAAHLLPENTVLYVRFPVTAETVAKFKETAIGRITQDPAMKPDMVNSADPRQVGHFTEHADGRGMLLAQHPLTPLVGVPGEQFRFRVFAARQSQDADLVRRRS